MSQSTSATLWPRLQNALRFLRQPAPFGLAQRAPSVALVPNATFHAIRRTMSTERPPACSAQWHRMLSSRGRIVGGAPSLRAYCNLSPVWGSSQARAALALRLGIRHVSGRPPRPQSGFQKAQAERNKSMMMYMVATGILVVGFSYAAVPLYRMFCATTGFGGATKRDEDGAKIAAMKPVEGRELRIKFNADTAATMKWNFRPVQQEAFVVPGETALAFYTATNPTDDAVIGISTYNVLPLDAGAYFNKIQCFCFEEQRLNPHEQVDLPVFFYIDPEFAEDPAMWNVDEITLSYTFFESKDADGLVPGQMTPPTLPADRLQKHLPAS